MIPDHAAENDAPGLEEAIKWGMPSFAYQGKVVCGIAGFKAHCALWFRIIENAFRGENAWHLTRQMTCARCGTHGSGGKWVRLR